MKHTPGPWKVINGWDKSGKGKLFPSVVFCSDKKGNREKYVVVNSSHDQEAESIMANAKLIAAAPELLEALQGIIEIGKRDMSNPKYDGYFESAKAAIKKATE